MGRLDDKVVVITGGAGGIGKAAGKRFVAEGARVLLVDLDEAAVAEVGGNQISYCVADVTNSDDNARMFQVATERYGGVDTFLANAGIEGDVQSIVDYDEARFEQVMNVNIKGVFLGLKHGIPELSKRGGGSIVITSSVAGIQGSPGVAPYVTSKHAVIGLMRSAARECAPMNIRVNTVNPSPVETRMMRSLEEGMAPGAGDQAKQGIMSNIPLQRYAEPEDIANIMLFLASDESSWVTGSVQMADGGMTS